MSWIVTVHPDVSMQVRLLDASLRQEMIEKVAALAETRGDELRRSRSPEEPDGLWAHDYESAIIRGLRFVLLFDRIEGRERRLSLVLVRHSMMDETESRE